MNRQLRAVLRYAWIVFGLFFMANGIVFVVRAQIGVAPWDVLHLGISYQTGISLGRVLQGVGLLVVLVSWVFHVAPRFVTILNMILIGYFVDMINSMSYIPIPEATWLKFVCYLTGVAVCGFGTALYISGNRGAGPRDSLMLAMTKATSLRISIVRTAIEVVVTIAGYLLGGPLGVGTVLFALLIGPFIELGFATINLFKYSTLFTSFRFHAGEGLTVKTFNTGDSSN
ncbi:MAG: hypothetical protein SCK29_01665 [Bacillota bacterium]|nr:hypothetical protein [Bacillota bacterium]MDW7682808.1 hypothetical protein [Bacillota bacterium]